MPEPFYALLRPVSLAGLLHGFVGFGASMPNVMVLSVVLGRAES